MRVPIPRAAWREVMQARRAAGWAVPSAGLEPVAELLWAAGVDRDSRRGDYLCPNAKVHQAVVELRRLLGLDRPTAEEVLHQAVQETAVAVDERALEPVLPAIDELVRRYESLPPQEQFRFRREWETAAGRPWPKHLGPAWAEAAVRVYRKMEAAL